jgi:hypothetical protein
VTAGLRYASRLPQAIAVNMPAMTANAHPAVITIHPEPSPLVRLDNVGNDSAAKQDQNHGAHEFAEEGR